MTSFEAESLKAHAMNRRILCFLIIIALSLGDVCGLMLWLIDGISIRWLILWIFVLHIVASIIIFLSCRCPRCGLLLFVRRNRHFGYIALPWPARKCARCNLELGSDYVQSVSEAR